MRGRWSFGVVVAIVVAIAVATAERAPQRVSAAHAEAPVQVTLALRSDRVEVRITSDDLALAFRF